MENAEGNTRFYVPKWALAVLVLLLLAGLVVFLVLAVRHRSALSEVSQKNIFSQSAVLRKVGLPGTLPQPDKNLNILFYYDGYSNDTEAQHFVGLMEATLATTQPFANAGNIQMKAFTSSKPKCHTEKHGGHNLLVCDKSLINLVNDLHIARFKLVILSPQNFVPNATVAYGKNSVMYLPTYQGALTKEELDEFISRYFMHELGHSLGLRDEYARQRPESAIGDVQAAQATSSNVAFQPAQPNCAPDKATAEKWWGNYVKAAVKDVGYYNGCAGREDYYYPVQGTLMSDDPTVETYGRVSEDYLRNVLQCFYAGQSAITYPAANSFAGMTTNCSDFKKQYPNFWQH